MLFQICKTSLFTVCCPVGGQHFQQNHKLLQLYIEKNDVCLLYSFAFLAFCWVGRFMISGGRWVWWGLWWLDLVYCMGRLPYLSTLIRWHLMLVVVVPVCSVLVQLLLSIRTVDLWYSRDGCFVVQCSVVLYVSGALYRLTRGLCVGLHHVRRHVRVMCVRALLPCVLRASWCLLAFASLWRECCSSCTLHPLPWHLYPSNLIAAKGSSRPRNINPSWSSNFKVWSVWY